MMASHKKRAIKKKKQQETEHGWLAAASANALSEVAPATAPTGELTAGEVAAIDRALKEVGRDVPVEDAPQAAPSDDDELRSCDERAIDEFLGDEDDGEVGSDDASETLAGLAASFLRNDQGGKRTARRKRQRERAKEKAAADKKAGRHETTAYVRFHGKFPPTKRAVEAFFTDRCPEAKARVVLDGNDLARAAFVQTADAVTFAEVLACNNNYLDKVRLSVKHALTPSGLQAVIERKTDPRLLKKREKKAKKKKERRQEATAAEGQRKRHKAATTSSHAKLLVHRRPKRQKKVKAET